jgi:Flp pilus assembly protein protease CpaA
LWGDRLFFFAALFGSQLLLVVFEYFYKEKLNVWIRGLSLAFTLCAYVLFKGDVTYYLLLCLTASLLVYISYFDYKHGEIPHVLTLLFFGAGFLYAFFNSFRSSLMFLGIVLVIMVVLYYLCNFVLKQDLGGGDVKLFIIAALFFPFFSYLNFLIFNAIVDSGVLAVRHMFKDRSKNIRYAPVFSVSLLGFLLLHKINFISLLLKLVLSVWG